MSDDGEKIFEQCDLRHGKDFIDAIIRKVDFEGIGFVPFIGSGISQPSGIMTGREISQYLSYVIYKIIKPYYDEPNNQNHYKINGERWNLAIAGWPRTPTQKEVAESKKWIAAEYAGLLNQYHIDPFHACKMDHLYIYSSNDGCFDIPPAAPIEGFVDFVNGKWISRDGGDTNVYLKVINDTLKEIHGSRLHNSAADPFHPKRGVSVTSKTYLKESAIRALYDWRLCLQFLARLRTHEGLLILGDQVDQYVIDSFNIFMTKGRRPNLAHQMLAFLTRTLKIRTLIATNFDTLIEDAFRDIDKPLRVISVEKHSRLPNPDSVTSRKTLLKIHGSLHETRADISLDDIPTAADKDAFLRYIWPLERTYPATLPSCLLVMGTTIPDKRTVALIKYVCDVAPKEFQVFVIAFDAATLRDIKAAFGLEYIPDEPQKKYMPKAGVAGSENKFSESRFVFTLTRRLDLLLFELYQTKNYALPPAGFNYRINQYIPPFNPINLARFGVFSIPGYEVFGDDRKFTINDIKSLDVWKRGVSWADKKDDKERKIVIIEGRMFVTQMAAALFHRLEEDYKNCIWFELEDFKDTASVLTELFDHISIQLGVKHIETINVAFNLDNVSDGDLFAHIQRRARVLGDHYGIVSENWYLFFYGRNVPTSCFGFGRENLPEIGDEKAIAELQHSLFFKFYRPFWWALEALRSLGFNVVYLPRTREKAHSYVDVNEKYFELFDERSAKQLHAFVQAMKGYAKLYDKHYEEGISKPISSAKEGDLISDKEERKIISNAVKYKGLVSEEQKEPRIFRSIGAFYRELKTAELVDVTNKLHRFVYAATLFRQSRNVSSLVIEAFHTEILRYSKYLGGKEGIKFHDEDIDGELREKNRDILLLRDRLAGGEIQFFNRKSGGSVWMFGEQRLLANMLSQNLPRGNKLAGKKAGRNQRASKAIKHYWIGIWYLRAFYSSMDIDPLRECLYHLFMCRRSIRFASYTMPKDEPWYEGDTLVSSFVLEPYEYRLTILASSLFSIAKVMQIALDSHARWSRTYDRMKEFFFGEIALELDLADLKRVSSDGQPEFLEITTKLSTLNQLPAGVHAAIKSWAIETIGEGEAKGSSVVTDGDIENIASSFLIIREICTQLERDIICAYDYSPGPPKKYENFSRQVKLTSIYESVFKPYFDFSPEDCIGDLLGEIFFGFYKKYEEPIADFFKRTVAISLKYVEGEGRPGSTSRNVSARVMLLKNEIAISLRFSSVGLYQYLLFVTEFVYLLIRQAKFERRRDCIRFYTQRLVKAAGQSGAESSPLMKNALWELIGVWSQLGMELLHGLPPAFLPKEYALRVRLLTYSAMSLGRLGKFSEAHQNLNTATGIVVNLSSNESRVEAVILRIRRAEIHIYEAMSLAGDLRAYQRDILENGEGSDFFPEGGSHKDARALYGKHLMQLDDALSTLDDASALNNQCRNSSFWSSKIHYYRILIFAEYFTPYYVEDVDENVKYGYKNVTIAREKLMSIMRRPRIYSDIKSARSHLLEELERGILGCGDETYRKFCFINIFIKSFRKYKFFCKSLGIEADDKAIGDFKSDARVLLERVLGIKGLSGSKEENGLCALAEQIVKKNGRSSYAASAFALNVCAVLQKELC